MSAKNSNVLFFGPYPKPITGQSVAFKQIFDNFDGDKVLCDITKYNKYIYLNMLYVLFFLPIIFMTKNIGVVYFTCSRSKNGFVRDFWLILLSYIFRVKIINHIHGNDFKSFIDSFTLFKFLPRWAYNRIDITVLLLEQMKDQLIDFPNTEIKVIANAYSESFSDISFDKLVRLKSKNGIEIVFLSNIMCSKGILIFLDSLYEVLSSNKKIKVKIAGQIMGDYLMDGDAMKKEFYEKYNLLKKHFGNSIEYIGVVNGIEKERFLSNSSIFILPTIYKTEGFPISIIEAMFFGNVVVTNNINYLSDIVSEKNGIIISEIDSKKLAKSILELLNNSNEMNSIMHYNFKESRAKYDPKKYIDSVSEVIFKKL